MVHDHSHGPKLFPSMYRGPRDESRHGDRAPGMSISQRTHPPCNHSTLIKDVPPSNQKQVHSTRCTNSKAFLLLEIVSAAATGAEEGASGGGRAPSRHHCVLLVLLPPHAAPTTRLSGSSNLAPSTANWASPQWGQCHPSQAFATPTRRHAAPPGPSNKCMIPW